MAQAVQVGLEFVGGDTSLRRNIARGLAGATADLRTFDRQLEYANRRVLAFGAAATTLYGTVRAFKELVSATVQVEKSLTSMNTIFQLNRRELESFSRTLFNVARQTGQSFDIVSKAAEEFARQGLNMEETARRTRDAMLLVRLSGVDVTKAVNGLTAAMATFGKTGTDTTRIVNQLVAVDQAFAVSAGGLIDAFSKVGSVVDDAGVSMEEFIGLVTAARQITSRSESVIGNSLKTIFTRLERSSTLEQLEEMGVAVRDLEGNVKPALLVFDALAQSYKNMTRAQQQQVAELGAGVFQINQFKALISDLGKENGLYAQAVERAASATNEAMLRNRMASQTLASSIQNLKTSATEAASVVGELSIRPFIEGMLDVGKLTTSMFANIRKTGDTKMGEDLGAWFGESILKGIGNFMGTGGIVLLARFVGGALSSTVPEILKDIGTTGGFIKTRKQEEQSLSIINNLLKQATTAEKERFLAAKRVADQEFMIVQMLERQVGLRAGTLTRGMPRPTSTPPRAAEGFVAAMSAERAAINAGVGGAPPSARPVYLPSFNRGGGKYGIVANTSEFIVPGAAGGAIFTRDMARRYGLPPGSTPVAAGGFIPHAAEGGAGGLFGHLPMRIGSAQFGLGVPPQTIGKLEDVFKQLSSSKTVEAASKFADQIDDMTKGFDKASRTGILKMVGQVFSNLPTPGTLEAKMANWVPRINIGSTSQSGAAQFDPVTGLETSESYQARMAARRLAPSNYTTAMRGGIATAGPNDIPPVIGSLGAPGLREKQRALRAGISIAAQEMAARDRQKADLQAIEAREAVQNEARQRRLNRMFTWGTGAAIGASILSGTIPQRAGGSGSGMALGALSGGLTGLGAGALAGGAFGPAGIGIGAAVGGIGGAVIGLLNKITKSFEEVRKEIENQTSELQREVDSVTESFRLLDTIGEARANGAKKEQIALLQQQFGMAIRGVRDPRVQAALLNSPTQEQREEILRNYNVRTMNLQTQTNLKAAIGSALNVGFWGTLTSPTKEDREAAQGAFRQSFSQMTDEELADELARMRDPNYAQQQNEKLGGQGVSSKLLARFPRFFSAAPGLLPWNAIMLQRRDKEREFTFGTARAAASEEILLRNLIRQAETGGVLRGRSQLGNREMARRLSQLALGGALDQLTIGSGMRNRQAEQQMLLSDPSLDPIARLLLGGDFGAENIRSQFAGNKVNAINTGRQGILQVLRSNNVRDESLWNQIGGIGGRDGFANLLKQLNDGGLSVLGTAKDDVRDKLQEIINQLDELHHTEEAALDENKKSTEFERQTLQRMRTLEGVRSGLRTSLREGRLQDELTAQSILSLAKERDLGITGSQVESAKMLRASQIGQEGDTMGSFLAGASAPFRRMRQDLTDLSQVGQQVAASLEQNLGNAFGDFIVGAQSGKDAFRSFAASVMQDAARALAAKGVQMLLGLLFNALPFGATPTTGVAVGTPVPTSGGAANIPLSLLGQVGVPGGASGGALIPAMTMGGEFVFNPSQAAKIGRRRLDAMNSFAAGGPAGLIRGGSGFKDDVFLRLAAGSYVINQNSTSKIGADNLAALAGATTTMTTSPVDQQMTSAMFSSGTATPVPISSASGGGNVNVTVGVTINDNSTSSTTRTGGDGAPKDRQFGEDLGRAIEQIVMTKLAEQSRTGGMIRRQSLAFK